VKQANFDSVLTLVKQKETELNSVNIATALHRVAVHTKRSRAERDRMLRDPRFLDLVDFAQARAPECNPRSVSDVMWACATLQHWPPTMLKPLLTQVSVHLDSSAFEPQHLSLIVWALAVLQCKPVKLLEQIEQQAITQIDGFNMQNCANLLWGFAKLNYKAEAALKAVSARVGAPGMLSECKPVEVTDLAFAVAILGDAEADEALLSEIARRATHGEILSKFTSRQIVTLLWSFARLKTTPAGAILDDWVEAVAEAHRAKPLLAGDQRNCRRALEALGQSTEFLDEKDEEEGEGKEEGEGVGGAVEA